MAKSAEAKQLVLDTREANKRIREESRLEKQAEKTAARGIRSGLKALNRSQHRHPGNPKKQLAMFLSEFVIKSAIGRSRPVSDRTRQSYGDNLMGCLDDLKTVNASVKNLSELGRKHALALVRYWMEQGQANSTIQNKVSILRCFLGWIGKEDAIPRATDFKTLLQKNGIEAPTWKQTVATESKAWSDKGVSLEDVVRRVREICPVTALQLEMCEAFGLRKREVLFLTPLMNDRGDLLEVTLGTKGGLPRMVPFSKVADVCARQREVLNRAKEMARNHPKRQLTRPGYSLQSNIWHFNYVLGKAGVTQKDLGVTAHGLRHQFAGRMYQELSGLPTPVSGAMPVNLTPEQLEADHEARGTVSVAMGHFRYTVIGAYVGTVPTMSRARKERVEGWINMTEGNERFQAVLKKYGVTEAWLGGRFASGLEVLPEEPLRLHVKTQSGLTEEVLFDLQSELAATIMRGIDASQFKMPGAPESVLAIVVKD